MDRRRFLQTCGLAPALALPGISGLAFSADPAPKQALLVVLFLRGGADGLHLVAPASDPDYIAARPADLRIADAGDKAGHLLDRGLQEGFRLHADAPALAQLYRDGRLVIVHAAGLTSRTRSHFVAQDLMERGVADEKQLSVEGGWLARALGPSAQALAFSATAAPAYALRGASRLLAAPDLAGGLALPWGEPTQTLLRTLAGNGKSPAHLATRNTLDLLQQVDAGIKRDAGGKIQAYLPAGTLKYEGSGDLYRTLTAVARLARSDLGLRVACIDHGGWDTHEGQAGRLANQVRQLSQGLAALHDDLAAADRPVVVVTLSEFGRRLRANKSGGTDHGHGGVMFVSGTGVRGGRMAGTWPGLSTPNLADGVDLAVTTDYRSVLAEVLQGVGLPFGASFPGWQPPRTDPALGLFQV